LSHAPQVLTAEQASRLEQAFRLLQQGRHADALPIALGLAGEAPKAPDAQHLMALCHSATGNAAEAEQAYRAALELAPRNHHVLGNYGNLLKALGRHEEALARYRSAVEAAPDFVQGWTNYGRAALEVGDTALALTAFDRALALQPGSAVAWQLIGSARRAAGDLDGAEAAYRKAVGLQPSAGRAWVNLGVILRLLARPAESIPCYEQASRAGFKGPELTEARAGALVDIGELGDALEQARELTRSFPEYVPGHVTLANLLWEYGGTIASGEDPFAAFRATARAQPGNDALQGAFVRFLLEAQRADEAIDRLRSMRSRGDHPILATMEANALEILGRSVEAGVLYERAHRELGTSNPSFLNAYARHLLKAGRWDEAAARSTEATQTNPDNQEAWAYLSTAWRLLDDPREHWLCDYERLIGLVEVEPPVDYADRDAFLAALNATLEPMHKALREPVHQSLRGGSQTPGRLFGRPDPVIELTRRAITAAVERHIATLPDDPEHPFLRRKARSIRYTGSWSVKLWSSGRHVNHIHPEGWMSSACYVSLPPSVRGQSEAGEDVSGCIQFGQAPVELGLDLPPRRVIHPRLAHIALFPSYMWHGTVPFVDEAPRVTIAFDMLPVP
jgi:tetratricopeptide (TPR) repeat protein